MKREHEFFDNLRKDTETGFDTWKDNIQDRCYMEEKLISRNRTIRSVDFIVDELEREFAKNVKLDVSDIGIAFLGAALQCVRQFLLTPFVERTDHRTAEQHAKKPKEFLKSLDTNASKGLSEYYYATLEEIITKPGVPYDITADITDMPSRLSGVNHRNKTWGHDPVFGYIFGTANILTNTISYSAVSGHRIAEIGTITTKHVGRSVNNVGGTMLAMTELADTGTMLKYSIDRVGEEPVAVGAALIKQYAHLKSDEYSKLGLPIPGTNLAPNLSRFLTDRGLDYANTTTIAKQGACAAFVNYILRVLYMLHAQVKQTELTKDMLQVKANRVITVSNVLEEMIVTAYALTTEDYTKLDIGGLVVLVQQIATDIKFRREMQKMFIENKLYEMLED